jgi:hypothetical protein
MSRGVLLYESSAFHSNTPGNYHRPPRLQQSALNGANEPVRCVVVGTDGICHSLEFCYVGNEITRQEPDQPVIPAAKQVKKKKPKRQQSKKKNKRSRL